MSMQQHLHCHYELDYHYIYPPLLTVLTDILFFLPFDLKFCMCILTCLRNLITGAWGRNSLQIVVINGFNGNPYFSTFWSEILHVCSYLFKKPNDRCLETEFLRKRTLLTVLTEIHIFQPFGLKFCMCVLTCLRNLMTGVWRLNSFANGRC